MFEGFVPDDERFEWLTKHASGWQFGEQGILLALVDAINPNGQCIEIGAGDGEGLPLTIDRFYKRGNDCVLFEADMASLGKLMLRYPKADLRGEFAGDLISVQQRPALIVIDIDSYELASMQECLSQCYQGILMVEHFDKAHKIDCNQVHDVPDWLLGVQLDGNFKIQDNAATISYHADVFGYHRVGTTRVNSIFVHDSHLSKVSR
jgi:hypothetical protein